MRMWTWIGRKPGQGHADGRAGHGVFGQRRAEDALGAVLLGQAARGPLDGLGIVHVQAEHDDGRVAPAPGRSLRGWLRRRRAAAGPRPACAAVLSWLPLLRAPHPRRVAAASRSSLKTSLSSSAASGNGLASAKAKAAAISASTSASMPARSRGSIWSPSRRNGSAAIHGASSSSVR